jgi:hypothetical protein
MSRPELTANKVAPIARSAIDAVITHHRDGFRSGVARFNEQLAERLRLPLLGLEELEGARPECPLLSFKVSELGAAEGLVDTALEGRWEVFLHEYRGVELERRLVAGAQRVHCGNSEILDAVRDIAADAQALWTPGLIADDRPFRPAELSVFSFGMAHKIRLDMFGRLRSLLDSSKMTYAVYVSAANHEAASLRDSEQVFLEMHDIFPAELYFLGNLSDVAVFNHLRSATFFAAFFERGVRANNTSVASAMERGAVVITNLDNHSPPEYAHMENLIDIELCEKLPSDPLVLKRLSLRAMETGRIRGWDALTAELQ